MKVLTVILLGVFALGIVTFKSVTSLPKVKTTPAPFNWQQFVPGYAASAERRGAVGSDPSTSDGVYGAVPPNNPMSPYLNLKPFLPVKPTVVSPFVDPNIFIGKKAELLNNLFGSGVGPAPAGTPSFIPPWVSGIKSPSFFAEKKTTLLGLNNPATDMSSSSPDSKRGLSEESTVSAEPRLVGGPSLWGPPPGVIPTPKPSIEPPGFWSPAPASGPVPPVVDPMVMLDKKTKFLNDLFNSLSTPGVSARALVPDTEPTPKPTAVPPGFWLQFIPGYATPPPPTEKPTIVPPSFWIPSPVTKPTGPFGPSVPVVSPAQMIDKKTEFLNSLFNSLNISVTPAPVTTPAPTLDPVAAYQEKVAEFLDKLFDAILNNDSNEVQQARRALDDQQARRALEDQARRALETADKAKTSEDLKTFLGEIETVEENAEQLENELDTRSAFQRSADDSNDTVTAGAQKPPVDALLTAKDKVVATIIAEMGGIKNNILETLAELLEKQKEAAATLPPPPPTPPPVPKKKIGPPFGPGGPFGFGGPFGPWAAAAAAPTTTTTPKPTPDPEPFQKKVEFLGQVFDTLTQLEKDVSEALNKAVSEAAAVSAAAAATTPAAETTTAGPTTSEPEPTHPSTTPKQNATANLLDLLRSKLAEIANSTAPNQQIQQVPKFARAVVPFGGKPMGPPAAIPTVVDPSFWIPNAGVGVPVGPDYYMGKTQEFLSKLFESKAKTSADASSKARSIKMAVHQGYQSLPPGSEELLQAGGGSSPEKHEGGGLKLQEAGTSAIPSIFQGGVNHHRHHNHHNRE